MSEETEINRIVRFGDATAIADFRYSIEQSSAEGFPDYMLSSFGLTVVSGADGAEGMVRAYQGGPDEIRQLGVALIALAEEAQKIKDEMYAAE